jgi:hypothetical protein
MSKLPKIADLYNDKLQVSRNDAFVTLLNQAPKPEWVKTHPFIKGYKYLPIERIEYLLKNVFKRYRIEVTGQGTAFNGVWVSVRVHYFDQVNNEWSYHDGIGAMQLQTSKGTSPADLANINNGALSMAFPAAKTVAIKDACDHFGKLFGSDLNRKEEINYTLDVTLIPMDEKHPNWNKVVEAVKNGTATIEQIKSKYELTENAENELTKF